MGSGTSGKPDYHKKNRGTFLEAGRRAAETTNNQRVVYGNSDDQKKLGKTWDSLMPFQKQLIGGMLAITKADYDNFVELESNNMSISDAIQIAGVKYGILIEHIGDDFKYTVKQRNKKLVNRGTYANAANELAMLMKKASKR